MEFKPSISGLRIYLGRMKEKKEPPNYLVSHFCLRISCAIEECRIPLVLKHQATIEIQA
jgi:hypothetical protein